jgi:haloalkane dehalogenase
MGRSGQPDVMVGADMIAWCQENIANLVTAPPAGHLVPEDQPDAIANAIIAWAAENKLR